MLIHAKEQVKGKTWAYATIGVCAGFGALLTVFVVVNVFISIEAIGTSSVSAHVRHAARHPGEMSDDDEGGTWW